MKTKQAPALIAPRGIEILSAIIAAIIAISALIAPLKWFWGARNFIRYAALIAPRGIEIQLSILLTRTINGP